MGQVHGTGQHSGPHEQGVLVGLEEDDDDEGGDEEHDDDGVGEGDSGGAGPRGDREVLVDVVARRRGGLDGEHVRALQPSRPRHKQPLQPACTRTAQRPGRAEDPGSRSRRGRPCGANTISAHGVHRGVDIMTS